MNSSRDDWPASAATATVTNSTLSGNSASSGGGIHNTTGIFVSAGTATVTGSIVANSVSGGDIVVSAGSLGGSYNLIEDGSGDERSGGRSLCPSRF